jgi:hypothetical protein
MLPDKRLQLILGLTQCAGQGLKILLLDAASLASLIGLGSQLSCFLFQVSFLRGQFLYLRGQICYLLSKLFIFFL